MSLKDEELAKKIEEIVSQHSQYGYRKVYAILRFSRIKTITKITSSFGLILDVGTIRRLRKSTHVIELEYKTALKQDSSSLTAI